MTQILPRGKFLSPGKLWAKGGSTYDIYNIYMDEKLKSTPKKVKSSSKPNESSTYINRGKEIK